VFTARFVPGLKVVAAPAAGIAYMPWRSFVLWHTLAAIVFTLGFGLAAFVAGAAAIELLEHYGAYGLVPIAAALAALIVLRRRRRRARVDEPADALA
jgi:membrane protein DedA with SNARE-associated domain